MAHLVVTGAGRGIGAAVALVAAERGYDVAVNYARDEASARAVVARIAAAGGRATAIQADVSIEADVIRLFDTAERELGPVDGLVANAGITGGFCRVEDLEARTLERVLAVNVTGVILCAREAVRRMLRDGRGGAIVNISSIAARRGGAGEWVHYAASKGAVESFTIGLGREVAANGIRVNAVAPGLTDTELHTASGDGGRLERLAPVVPAGRIAQAREIAEGVLWMLSPAASYMNGAVVDIGGGR